MNIKMLTVIVSEWKIIFVFLFLFYLKTYFTENFVDMISKIVVFGSPFQVLTPCHNVKKGHLHWSSKIRFIASIAGRFW